jgi:hypothetical protein
MTAKGLRRLALPSLALSVLLSGSAPAAEKRSRLLDDDYEVFAQEAPADEEPAQRRQDERRRANDGDWFRAPVQGPQDFPADELREAVDANARAATARAMYRRAESTLHATVRDAQRDFDESKELKDALAAEKKAYDALQDARRDALQTVADDPKYQAMIDLREGLTRQIADRREGVTPAPLGPRLVATAELTPVAPLRGDEGVVAIATVKLRVGRDARAMERDALDGNDRLRQARADLANASAKVAELRRNFAQQLRESDDLKQARAELEDARVARLTAETYNAGAIEAAKEALDFSYFLHRYDYYRYPRYGLGYYDSYGSRYGYPHYGVSYWGRRR